MAVLAFGLFGQNAILVPQETLGFDIHFVILSNKAEVRQVATKEQMAKEVEILNHHFVTEEGKPVLQFRLKSVAFFHEIQSSRCSLVKLADVPAEYDGQTWQTLFNGCDDAKVVDPHAINFYVYDSYKSDKGFSDTDSHGRKNHHRPYVLIDFARLNHKNQAPEEHEMGHAFGLSHVCVPGAKRDSDTNIMASSECGQGSGGLRNLGFNLKQVAIILEVAHKVQKRLMAPD
ncbi:MAG: hypothetical protein HQL94_03630 [Magnetococcales bacterium]|nr:hypothetical protein [Magnetococcales bacterium]MBF0439576.1 hypothetical protein [Magnetococcales bacterium]